VYLQNCKLLPSFSKSNPERKFQIEFSEQIHKPLLLECKSQRQRNDWYFAISIAVNKARDLLSKAWLAPEIGLHDEKNNEGLVDIIAPKDFAKDNENREEGEAPVNFVDELNYVDGLDASSSEDEDFGYNSRYENSQNYPNQDFAAASEPMLQCSFVDDLKLARPQSAPILIDEGINNPAIQMQAVFRRAVIMSPQLKSPAFDGGNRVAGFSIRRHSLNSKMGVRRNSPKQEAARLSRVDEEIGIYEMEEKDDMSKSASVKHIHKRSRSKIRRLSQFSEEVQAPPGARRRSLFARYPKPKKGMRRRSCTTQSKIPGSQSGAQPGAQPGAEPAPGRRSSFLKISLNDFNET